MKRKALAAVAVVALTTLGMTGTALASANVPATVRGARAPQIHRGGAPRITPGSVWTYYDFSVPPALVPCEVLTFASGGVFSSDRGDTGTWTSTATTAKIVFQNGAFLSPATFTGQWTSGTHNFTGTLKEKSNGLVIGPEGLFRTSDPLGYGTC
jgi:hypothetical protein